MICERFWNRQSRTNILINRISFVQRRSLFHVIIVYDILHDIPNGTVSVKNNLLKRNIVV